MKRDKDTEGEGHYISISGDGVFVHSSKSSLRELESLANRLLKKHKKFIAVKRKSKIISGVG